MDANPYAPPATSGHADANGLTAKELAHLRKGYSLALGSMVVQVAAPVILLLVEKRVAGLGTFLFCLSIIGPAFLLHPLRLTVGRRVLVVLGLLVPLINVVVTQMLRIRAAAALRSHRHTVSFWKASPTDR
jgi:hypothetical protein